MKSRVGSRPQRNRRCKRKRKPAEDRAFRDRSLHRLWNRDYRIYRKMIEAGYVQDTKTGGWRYKG